MAHRGVAPSLGLGAAVLALALVLTMAPFEALAQQPGYADRGYWNCIRSNQAKGGVTIWWGYTQTDASWACNTWNAACGGQCTAYAVDTWSCIQKNTNVRWPTPIDIWWGFTQKDGEWGCNNLAYTTWCSSQGGCRAEPVFMAAGTNDLSTTCTSNPANGWCVHAGAVYQYVDCNGDGRRDHTCYDAAGNRGVVTTGKNGCFTPSGNNVGAWPSAPPSACPAAFSNTQPPATSVGSIITRAVYNQFFGQSTSTATPGCFGEFYTYDAFIAAAAAFPTFGTEGSQQVRVQEVAAFLAQISHETTGAAPGAFDRGLCFTREGQATTTEAQMAPYCDPNSAQYPCAAGKKYFGRGPIQISWNYNYGQAGASLGLPLLANPEVVLQDPVIAFKTAFWFWMTPQAPKPSCHSVMVSDPTNTQINRFGQTTNIINGALECGPNAANMQGDGDRVGYFKRYLSVLGSPAPADNLLTCRALAPFT